MFQSTPGIAAGRILAKLEFMRASTDVSIHARHCCRANRIAKHKEAEAAKVSIHARHCCRANRHDVSLENSAKVFQSTPGIAAGRIADTLRDDYKLLYVSIHARHCCRANPASFNASSSACGFQSTPGIAAGRIVIGSLTFSDWSAFQSTPGIAAGRIMAAIVALPILPPFQSTPGIAAGRIALQKARF